MRSLLALVLLLLAACPAAAARSPWDLRCPSMPAEQPSPRPLARVERGFFPWLRPAPRALRAGPVSLVALSSRTAISRDGDERDGENRYLHRALLAVAPGQG